MKNITWLKENFQNFEIDEFGTFCYVCSVCAILKNIPTEFLKPSEVEGTGILCNSHNCSEKASHSVEIKLEKLGNIPFEKFNQWTLTLISASGYHNHLEFDTKEGLIEELEILVKSGQNMDYVNVFAPNSNIDFKKMIGDEK